MLEVLSVASSLKNETYTIEKGCDVQELMARAANILFKAHNYQGPVAIIAGYGNNAGDGFALALLLKEHNIEVEIFLLAEKFSPAGFFYYQKCQESRIKTHLLSPATNFEDYKTLVDCLFGTGFKGEVKGLAKEVIEKINLSSAYVISADINSGLNSDNGLTKLAVKSDLTIAIGTFKPGHFLAMAKDYIKEKVYGDIGLESLAESYYLIEKADVKEVLKTRKQFSHKGDYGYIALIGGSIRYSGAIKLANLAATAMYSGAGVVKLAVPKRLVNAVLPYILESTVFPLSSHFQEKEIEELIFNTKAVAVGMGYGQNEHLKRLITYLLKNYQETLIFDADALNILAEMDKKLLKERKAQIVLTPHLKEFSRLCEKSIEEINTNPIKEVQSFAKKYNLTLLLKGPTSIVSNGQLLYLVDRGTAGMASAGSGDVFAGVLCALCGQSKEERALVSACAAYINGLAGEEAESEACAITMLASDSAHKIKRTIELIVK